ncbi:hypothetical protein SBRCBS47491_002008 [Sporothrix bragantina]|uniref:Cwf18 pre-mRNA splicing factor n=1 Tax=Sporothrix bragantina TaxID=671064 RepID=A0ABP0B461_9PEZI
MSSRAALSAAADDRKARLAKLRSIKRKQPDDEVVAPESDRASPAVAHATEEPREEEAVERDVSRLHLSGRNYDPETRGARLGFETQPNLAAGDNTLEAQAAKLEAEVRRQQEEEEGGAGPDGEEGAGEQAGGSKPIDLFKLQPKKPNWDLKRELNKRLEPLNARTENAISRLVRERLAAKQQQKTGQPTAVKAAAASSSKADDEAGLDGAELVEGIRLREQEAEEEERRERELEDEAAA